jgi:hypothetical protein
MTWPTEFEQEKRRGMENAEREGMDKGKPRRRMRTGGAEEIVIFPHKIKMLVVRCCSCCWSQHKG